MADRHVVKLITQYLDHCAATDQAATLVGVCWFVDGNYRVVPEIEEINKALRKRPAVYIRRGPDGVVFAPSGTDRTVTADDMAQAHQQYTQEFEAAVGTLPGLGDALKKLPF